MSTPDWRHNAVLRIYRAILKLYPRSFRKKFESEMIQVFREQASDAKSSATPFPLCSLLIRTALDLFVAITITHLENLRETTLMKPDLHLASRALAVGGFASVLLAGLILLLYGKMPVFFQSTCKFRVIEINGAPVPTGSHQLDPFTVSLVEELVLSVDILSRVANDLDLNRRWSMEYLRGYGTLKAPETVAILRDRVSIRPYRNTTMFEVRVRSRSSVEAADIANAIANVFVTTPVPIRVQIVDQAEPVERPVAPNHVAWSVFGGGIALLAGTVTATIVWILSRIRLQHS